MKTNQNNEKTVPTQEQIEAAAGKVPVIFGIGSLGH